MRRAALVVLALVLSACDFAPSATQDLPSSPPPSPTTASAEHVRAVHEENVARRAWVRRVVSTAANRWPMPPDAQAVGPSRLGFLHRQRVEADYGLKNFTRSRFWLVPGDADQVLLEVAHHAAPGWGLGPAYAAGTWLGADSWNGDPPSQLFHRYLGPGPDSKGPYHQPRGYFSASVQTIQLGDQVAVRVDVAGLAVPARPARSFVTGVRSITFRQYGGPRGHRLIDSRELRGRLARHVAHDLNRIPAWTQFSVSCPMGLRFHYVLVLHAADGDLRADGTALCWSLWRLSRHGHDLGPLLAGPVEFFALVRRLGIVTPDM